MMHRGWNAGAGAGRRILRVGLGVCLAAALVAPERLEAQRGRPLSASGVQSLAFGTIFPGLTVSVPRTDALRTGQFQLTGTKNTDVQVTFTLPAALVSGGNAVPLQFAAGDGGVSQTATIGAATAFDPRVPLVRTLSQQGRLYLYLGGTLVPSAQQPAGNYTATITITVCYVGVTC